MSSLLAHGTVKRSGEQTDESSRSARVRRARNLPDVRRHRTDLQEVDAVSLDGEVDTIPSAGTVRRLVDVVDRDGEA